MKVLTDVRIFFLSYCYLPIRSARANARARSKHWCAHSRVPS